MSEKRMPSIVRVLWEEWDLWACAYCGHPYEEIEHVLPRSLGGTNDPRNLLPSCQDCNRGPGGKHNMDPVDWMTTRFPELLRFPVVFQVTL